MMKAMNINYDEMIMENMGLVYMTINKYYSSYATSGEITIVSDKYIFVSFEGGAFDKRKMYISINGASFKEVKKDKFNVI